MPAPTFFAARKTERRAKENVDVEAKRFRLYGTDIDIHRKASQHEFNREREEM